jgi:polyhydroxyalkanoate synthesis regulator phasin
MADTKNDGAGVTDVFERIFLLGVGVFSLTKEKIESAVEDLVERGKLSKEEGRSLVTELGERGMKEKDAFAGFVSEHARKAIDMANLASKDDVAKLQAEVARLKKDLAAAKKPSRPRTAPKKTDA